MSLSRRAALALPLAALAAATPPPARLAFFGFQMMNTSPLPTSEAERRRLAALDDLLRDRLAASGRYTFVPIPSEVRASMQDEPSIEHCNGCERDHALRAGADLAGWGVVQKVSNLILNINLYIEDAHSGRYVFQHSVDIRGNTDESWHHGLDYMLRHYLLAEP